ncbi:glycosyltransferase family 2 protein [Pedobacter agri]|uniref:glycosyltransferase family 2 protein n=1 Tax=Pedobacter agri TaxID=454586 RepID=UPI00292FD959|nr:glycosyltransferase family 2 protein [Pedobacter agri]
MSFNIKLPDLENYREVFKTNGVIYPLEKVPFKKLGLLADLPKIKEPKGWPWSQEYDPCLYSDRINWPKLSIVVPSYNQAAFLAQTLRAILLQNYPNLELIVIDGGSNDGSKEIIEEYSQWISYWQSEKDRGQGHAINLGFSLASGTYYAWINSDDYYLKGTFCKVMERFLQKNEDFVYGYVTDFIVEKNKFNPVNKILPVKDYFLRLPTLAQPACFWKAAIHQPIWEELHCSIDYELWLRLVKDSKKGIIKDALAVANIHGDAKTSDPKMKAKWDEDHQLICSMEAHGNVENWHAVVFLHRIRLKINKWFNL